MFRRHGNHTGTKWGPVGRRLHSPSSSLASRMLRVDLRSSCAASHRSHSATRTTVRLQILQTARSPRSTKRQRVLTETPHRRAASAIDTASGAVTAAPVPRCGVRRGLARSDRRPPRGQPATPPRAVVRQEMKPLPLFLQRQRRDLPECQESRVEHCGVTFDGLKLDHFDAFVEDQSRLVPVASRPVDRGQVLAPLVEEAFDFIKSLAADHPGIVRCPQLGADGLRFARKRSRSGILPLPVEQRIGTDPGQRSPSTAAESGAARPGSRHLRGAY